MSARAALDALLADVTPALRKAMERAYDLGYREAIAHGPAASAREPASDAAARASTGIDRLASDVLPQLPAPTPADARSNAPALFAWNQDSIQDDDDEDNQASTDGRRRRKSAGIRATSSVGALKTKIDKKFRLDRFDIEVIIARAGDSERRQLKTSAPLSTYLRTEDE